MQEGRDVCVHIQKQSENTSINYDALCQFQTQWSRITWGAVQKTLFSSASVSEQAVLVPLFYFMSTMFWNYCWCKPNIVAENVLLSTILWSTVSKAALTGLKSSYLLSLQLKECQHYIIYLSCPLSLLSIIAVITSAGTLNLQITLILLFLFYLYTISIRNIFVS